VVWALFCLALAHEGRVPSRTFVPIPQRHYYAVQALFVTPLLLLQWLVCSAISTTVARALGGSARFRETANKLGLALALPLLVLFLLPDVVVYALWGFPALGKLVRVTAPLSFAVTMSAVTASLQTLHGLSWARAFSAAALGVLAQTLLGAPLLR